MSSYFIILVVLCLSTISVIGNELAPGGVQNSANDDNYKYPWVVQLTLKSNTWLRGSDHIKGVCQGTMISGRKIITAAYCFYDARKGKRVTDLGRFGVQIPNLPTLLGVSSVVVHPDFDFHHKVHDLAIVFTSPSTQPKTESIALMDISNSYSTTSEYTEAFVIYHHDHDNKIKLPVHLLSASECNTHFSPTVLVAATQLCASESEPGNMISKGDSGSPLICVSSQNVSKFCGLVSYGSPPNFGKSVIHPVVYTKLGSYIPWINSVHANFVEWNIFIDTIKRLYAEHYGPAVAIVSIIIFIFLISILFYKAFRKSRLRNKSLKEYSPVHV